MAHILSYYPYTIILFHWFFFCLWYAKYYFLKNADPKNQIILFLFCWPTVPIFFAALPVDQKISWVSPKWQSEKALLHRHQRTRLLFRTWLSDCIIDRLVFSNDISKVKLVFYFFFTFWKISTLFAGIASLFFWSNGEPQSIYKSKER